MSSFLVDLWESVFTPGPTPTLLLATNATFGTLQLLLLVLLVTTASFHFGILSVLCAGLWYSINWFAREVQAAKAAEDASKAGGENNKDQQKDNNTRRQISPDPTGSDTETEADPAAAVTSGANPTRTTPEAVGAQRRKAPPAPQPGQAPMPPPTAPAAPAAVAPAPTSASSKSSSTQHLQPNPPSSSSPGLDGSQDLLGGRRRRSVGESSGYVSTDSEWEKVSDQEGK